MDWQPDPPDDPQPARAPPTCRQLQQPRTKVIHRKSVGYSSEEENWLLNKKNLSEEESSKYFIFSDYPQYQLQTGRTIQESAG